MYIYIYLFDFLNVWPHPQTKQPEKHIYIYMHIIFRKNSHSTG